MVENVAEILGVDVELLAELVVLGDVLFLVDSDGVALGDEVAKLCIRLVSALLVTQRRTDAPPSSLGTA